MPITPYEHICKAWAGQPGRFRYDPLHLTSRLNTPSQSELAMVEAPPDLQALLIAQATANGIKAQSKETQISILAGSLKLGCRDQVMRSHANDASMGAVDVGYEEECNRCNYRQDQNWEHAGTPLAIPH
jgi:hypothetical protein